MNYLLLMDDLRFYGATERKINGLVDRVRVATEDIEKVKEVGDMRYK